MSFLPIGLRWTFETCGSEQCMTLEVHPNELERFTVTFNPFPRGFSRGYLVACEKGKRDHYLTTIAQDRALRECFERFGVWGAAC